MDKIAAAKTLLKIADEIDMLGLGDEADALTNAAESLSKPVTPDAQQRRQTIKDIKKLMNKANDNSRNKIYHDESWGGVQEFISFFRDYVDSMSADAKYVKSRANGDGEDIKHYRFYVTKNGVTVAFDVTAAETGDRGGYAVWGSNVFIK